MMVQRAYLLLALYHRTILNLQLFLMIHHPGNELFETCCH